MAKTRQLKAETEVVKQREDKLDTILFECLEIMKMSEKWAMDRQGNMITVYPHPIVSREAHRVEGIEYLPHKSYYLPDVLLDRQMYWEDFVKETAPTAPKKYKVKGGRKPYIRVTDEMKEAIVNMTNKGVPLTDIAEAVGVSVTTVKKYYAQHQELVKEWADLRELGLTGKEIAEQYKVTEPTVWYYLKKEGYHITENKGFRKYSPEIIESWVRLKDNGATYKEIAQAQGITSHHVVKDYVLQYRKQYKEIEAVAN